MKFKIICQICSENVPFPPKAQEKNLVIMNNPQAVVVCGGCLEKKSTEVIDVPDFQTRGRMEGVTSVQHTYTTPNGSRTSYFQHICSRPECFNVPATKSDGEVLCQKHTLEKLGLSYQPMKNLIINGSW